MTGTTEIKVSAFVEDPLLCDFDKGNLDTCPGLWPRHRALRFQPVQPASTQNVTPLPRLMQ